MVSPFSTFPPNPFHLPWPNPLFFIPSRTWFGLVINTRVRSFFIIEDRLQNMQLKKYLRTLWKYSFLTCTLNVYVELTINQTKLTMTRWQFKFLSKMSIKTTRLNKPSAMQKHSKKECDSFGGLQSMDIIKTRCTPVRYVYTYALLLMAWSTEQQLLKDNIYKRWENSKWQTIITFNYTN